MKKLRFIEKTFGMLLMLAFALVGVNAMGSTDGLSLAVVPATIPTTEVEAIAKWAGKYSKQGITQMLNGLDLFTDLKVDRNVSRQGKLLPKLTVAAGMRPLDPNVEENGRKERTLGGRKLFVQDCMKLFKFIPEDVIESYMTDMLAPGAKQIPMAQWFWNAEFEKLGSEINDNFYLSEYHADADAFDAGATYSIGDYMKFTDDNYYKCIGATTAGQSPTTHPAKWTEVNGTVCFDGPAKIIADEITAGNLSSINTGSITLDDAVDQFESVYDTMTIAHRNKGGEILCGWGVYDLLLKSERKKYGPVATPDMGDSTKYLYASGKKWAIRPCTWMGNSSRIIVNLERKNLHIGTNLVSVPGVTKTVEKLHSTQSVAKWYMGFQVADLECLYVNDQA